MRKLFIFCLVLATLISCSMPQKKPQPVVLYEFVQGGISTCTAFPITNRIIITAAHCLRSKHNLQIILDENGKILAHIIYMISPEVSSIDSRADIARDIAIAVLDKEVNFGQYYKLSSEALDPEKDIFIDGYKWGEDRVATNSKILVAYENVMDLDYLGRKGVSGAPITYSGSPVVIGVFSSRNQHSDRGFGALITVETIMQVALLHQLVKKGVFNSPQKCSETKPGS